MSAAEPDGCVSQTARARITLAQSGVAELWDWRRRVSGAGRRSSQRKAPRLEPSSARAASSSGVEASYTSSRRARSIRVRNTAFECAREHARARAPHLDSPAIRSRRRAAVLHVPGSAMDYGIRTSSPARSPIRLRPFTSPLWAPLTGGASSTSPLAGTGYWGLSPSGELLSPRKRFASDVTATKRRAPKSARLGCETPPADPLSAACWTTWRRRRVCSARLRLLASGRGRRGLRRRGAERRCAGVPLCPRATPSPVTCSTEKEPVASLRVRL